MKFMIISDFLQLKKILPSTLFICLFIMVMMTVSSGDVIAGTAAVTTCLPYIAVYSIAANDEAAGWAKLRETMPVTKKGIVLGRYAGSLIVVATGCVLAIILAVVVDAVLSVVAGGSAVAAMDDFLVVVFSGIAGGAVALVLLAVILPLVMMLGLTRTARVLPLVFVGVFVGFFGAMGKGSPDIVFATLSLPVVAFFAVVVAVLLFAISAFVNYKLYERREF